MLNLNKICTNINFIFVLIAMEEPSINIYLEAKNEYTKRLTASLVPLLFEGFNSLYEDACKFKDETRDPRYDDYSELQIFQDYLKKIPKWNNDLIEQEYDRIVQRSKCKYLDELLWAVIFSNIKVLSVIRSKNPRNDVDNEYIALRDFIHKCYKECARELYSSDVVILFDKESVSVLERSKNVRDIKKIIEKGILESISESLPYKQIIRTYIGKIPAEYEEDTENSMSNPHFEANSFMKFLGKNRESFMAARTPTVTETQTQVESETEEDAEAEEDTEAEVEAEVEVEAETETQEQSQIEEEVNEQTETKTQIEVLQENKNELQNVENHVDNSAKQEVFAVEAQNQSDKEASIVSRASSLKSYSKEIRERQEIVDMSTDTDLAQDDVKIVVGSSKHHSHHSHHKHHHSHKSKPNFMKEGPKYEEEL
jgi:histone deacetylase 8/tripartite motif-containing protein 44